MEFLEYFQRRGILIEPFVTKKCNLQCRFCMYNCGPQESSDFISDEMLTKLKKQVDFLKKMNIPVGINLLGGEPTLFFDKLKHVVEVVSSWDVAIQMPTNGWWLEYEEETKKFMDIFSPLISKRVRTRISDEKFHREVRSKEANLDKLCEIFNSPTYRNIAPTMENPWIVWQDLADNYLINPHGRGKDVSNLNQYLNYHNITTFCTQEYEKHILDSIHYELNGNISSACMFGGEHSGVGTIDDNILYIIFLLERYREYRSNRKPYNCYNCSELFNSWLKKGDINKFAELNTFDPEKWEKTYLEILAK